MPVAWPSRKSKGIRGSQKVLNFAVMQKEQQQMPVECQQNCHFDRLMALDDELTAKLVVTLTTLECPLLTPFGQLI